MKKNLKYPLIYLILLLFFISACKDKTSVTVTGDLTGADAEVVILSNGFKDLLDTLNLTSGRFNYTLKLNQSEILSFTAGKLTTQLYLSPGKELLIDYNEIKKDLEFSGESGVDNTAIAFFNKLMIEVEKEHPAIQMAAYGEHEFVEKLNKKYNKAKEYLEMQKKYISKELYDLLVKRVNMASTVDMVRFPTYHQYATNQGIEMSQGYYEQISQINVNDPDLLDFPEGIALGNAMIEKDIDFAEIGSMTQYYQALVDNAKATFDIPQLKEYFTYTYLKNKINYGGGLDGIEDQLSSFYSSATNSYFINGIKEEEVRWKHLRSGSPAPDFRGITPEGEEVKLSDFKGKNVYIDVWATWCGPCIREIPSLKEIEHDFEDSNVAFVSISIDVAKDKEKWKKFIVEKNLSGTQLLAENDWRSEVATSYNISGIPRFILIGADGKILRADAPRPSDPELRDLLSEMGI